MKYNKKRLAYSADKVFGAKMGLLLRMFTFTMLLFFSVSSFQVVSDPSVVKPTVEMGVGMLILLTMANIGNIARPSSIDTAANQIGFRLWLVSQDQMDDTVAFPLPNANRELAAIPLKEGETFHYFEGIENSIKYTGTGESGDISPKFGKTIPIIIKYTDAALNFVEAYTGKGFFIAWRICETSEVECVGTFCKPVILQKFEVKQDGDGKYISLEFGNTHWRQPLKYVGDLNVASATVVATGETEIAIGAAGTYQLTGGAAAIATVSGITSADYGRYITIKAPASGVAPTIPDGDAFILRNGVTWTANPGSSLTLQVVDNTTLTEISRITT